MNNLPKIAISIGDLNGIGIEIALKCHDKISKICQPIYCINKKMLAQASNLLKAEIPGNFELFETKGEFDIKAGTVSKKSGKYSFNSFLDAINLASKKKVDAICTLPINKEAWNKADIDLVSCHEFNITQSHFFILYNSFNTMSRNFFKM